MRDIKLVLKTGIAFLILLSAFKNFAQQDPHYTQYMYNTVVVNPAYAGTKGYTSIIGLARTQWVGFKGAPDTQTLSFDTPIGHSRIGLGVNLINDAIGPARETTLDVNGSYSVQASEKGYLSFGLKIGGRLFSVDPGKGNPKHRDDNELPTIKNKPFPTIGAGIYYYTNKFYIGASVPNFIRTEHYNRKINAGSVGVERFHMFGIVGYVFDLTQTIKFKPATLVKAVAGSPLSLDASANFLFNNKFVAGVAWRWGDSISALIGLQVSNRFYMGYSYDLTTSNYANYNSGTHEIVLRLNFFKEHGIVSPRFF